MNNISLLVHRCRERGSYAVAEGQVAAEFLVQKFYALIAQRAVPGKLVEPGVTEYADYTGTRHVVYIRFYVNVTSNQRMYVIWCQALFPPAFPRSAPLFSVINIDHTKFIPNKLFAPNSLPDRSYAVKLTKSSEWLRNLHAEELLQEFFWMLNQHFPFHRANVISPPVFPLLYDPQYNGSFPLNEPYTINSKSSLPSTQNVSHIVQEAMKNIISEIEEELNQEDSLKARIEVTKKKVEGQSEVNEKRMLELKEVQKKLNEDQGSKDELIEELLAQEISPKLLEKIIIFSSEKEKASLKLQSRHAAYQDTAAFLETCYIENDTIPFEETLKSLEKLWKNEFDTILFLNEVLPNMAEHT